MRATSLDLCLLENKRNLPDGSIRSACPACIALGSDSTKDHLLIKSDGSFGCAVHAGDREHRKEIFKLVGKRMVLPATNGHRNGNSSPAFNWQKVVDAFTAADARKLSEWRGLSPEFVHWLHVQKIIGVCDGNFAFANQANGGDVVSAHIRLEAGNWIFRPKGFSTAPLVFGDAKTAGFVLAFESQWDAFAVMDKLGWHTANGLPDAAIFITRGAGNAKLIQAQVSSDAICYCFTQNDPPAQRWLTDVTANAGCKVLDVATPKPHKDCNEWIKAGANKSEIEVAMKAANPVQSSATIFEDTANAPDTGMIRGEILSILTSKLEPNEQRTKIANAVVSALAARGQFFFHQERKDFDSAMYFDGQRKVLLLVRSHEFLAWLAEWLAVNKAASVFKFIQAQVETTALAGSQTKGILPESFWASRNGAIYLSSGNGRLARITAGKVELADNATDGVLFASGSTLAEWELTEPENPFETCSLFSGANCAATHGPDLLRLFLFSMPTSPTSKPPLALAGDVGSGKTRLAKGIAELYGLPVVIHKSEDSKDGENDFWPTMDAGGLFTLDNCDTRNKWLPDAVAAASTGGGSTRQKKYTDLELLTLRPNAWLCMTTSNPTFASDSGLADRLLLVRMNRRTDETSDASLSDEIKEHRNAGLSFIARTLATALADMEKTPAGLNQRHPDFASFAVRIGRATGREAESIHALKSAEHDKSLFCLENDSIATALLSFLSTGETFNGTSAELRDKLIEQDTDLADKLSVKRLGKRLSALWPHFQKILSTCKQEKDRKGFSIYSLKAKSADYAEFQTAI
jgi:hypothetical protein